MRFFLNSFAAGILILFSQQVISQNCANNADFEMGNTTNWTCKAGGYGVGTAPPFSTVLPNTGCLNGALNTATTGGNTVSRHTMTNAAGGNAPNSTNPLVPVVAPATLFPSGTNVYSFRIGNDNTGNFSYGGKTLSLAESVKLSFMVTQQNAGFTYLYAVFLEDPSHPPESQPRFEIRVTDSKDSLIPCGYYKVVSGDTLAKKFYTGSGGYFYTNWTKVGLDLTGYIGQTVSIEFITSDCFPPSGGGSVTCTNNVCTTCNGSCCTTCTNGTNCTTTGCTGGLQYAPGNHSAYAYIDTYCQPLQIIQPVFCAGSTNLQLCAPPGYLGYTWPAGQPGLSGSPNGQCVTISNPIAGTTYSVNMQSVTGCPTNTTVTLKGFDINVNDTNICSGALSTYSMNATPNTPGSYLYSWSPGTGLSCTTCPNPILSPVPSTTSTYTVTVQDTTTGGCTVSKVLTINVGNNLPPITNSASLCPGDTVILTAPNGFPTHNWYYNGVLVGTGSTFPAGNTGTYSDTMVTAMGCKQPYVVNVSPKSISASIGNITHILCNGGNNGGATVTPTGTSNPTYLWSPSGGTGATATGLSAGTYTVTVMDGKCQAVQTVTLTQPPPPTPTLGTDSVCPGDNIVLNGPANGVTHTWYNSSGVVVGTGTPLTVTGIPGTTFTDTLQTAAGCKEVYKVTLTARTLSASITNVTHNNCNGGTGGSATVVPVGGSAGGTYTYSWSPGGGSNQTASNLPAGTYIVNVLSGGCSTTVQVTITEPPPITTTGVAGYFCPDDPKATLYAPQGFFNYQWYDSNGNPIPGATKDSLVISGPQIGQVFTVSYTDPSTGCAVNNTITLSLNPPPNLVLPDYKWKANVFTPNKDNVNDRFLVKFPYVKDFHLEVYDRWGIKMYESDDYSAGGWDGTFNSKDVPQGTYYWIASYTSKCTNDETPIVSHGFVHLMR